MELYINKLQIVFIFYVKVALERIFGLIHFINVDLSELEDAWVGRHCEWRRRVVKSSLDRGPPQSYDVTSQ